MLPIKCCMSTLQKKYANVVDDCTKALEHNNRYIKALFRRAKAAEVTSNLMQCLEGDFTDIFNFISVLFSCFPCVYTGFL